MTDDMERYYYLKDGNWEQISDESTTNNFYTLEQCANELNRLNKENEQLKTIISQLRTDNTKQKKKLNTAMKENEQLKKRLELYAEIYPTGRWITELKSEEIQKELE